MDYIGSEVSHKLFGLGRVTRIRGNYVFVSFEGNEVKMFQFPRAFESVLKFTNPDLQSAALADHQSFLAEERQRLEEAAERRRRIEVNIDEELRQRPERPRR